MKRIKLNKKRQLQLRFNYLFNKKSNYLKNLPKLKYDGLKEIENEKVEILIDKFLGINKFERDYSFFNPPLISMSTSPKEDPQKRKLKLFPDLIANLFIYLLEYILRFVDISSLCPLSFVINSVLLLFLFIL